MVILTMTWMAWSVLAATLVVFGLIFALTELGRDTVARELDRWLVPVRVLEAFAGSPVRELRVFLVRSSRKPEQAAVIVVAPTQRAVAEALLSGEGDGLEVGGRLPVASVPGPSAG
jgi:hypothetical protein